MIRRLISYFPNETLGSDVETGPCTLSTFLAANVTARPAEDWRKARLFFISFTSLPRLEVPSDILIRVKNSLQAFPIPHKKK